MAVVEMTIVGIVIAIAFYIHQKMKFGYWARKGVPYDEPHFLFGNIKKVVTQEHALFEYMDEQYQKHKALRFVGSYALTKPVLIVRDLELIKDITIKQFGSFVNRMFNADKSFDLVAGRLLFSRQDGEWRSMRHRMATAFSTVKLRNMFPAIKQVGEQLEHKSRKETVNGERAVEMRELSMRYAVDTITAVAFGSRGNAIQDKDSLMYKLLNKALSFDFYQGIASQLLFFARPLYSIAGRLGLPFHVFPKHIDSTIVKIVEAAQKERLQEKEKRYDIFDMILSAEEPEFQGLVNKSAAAFQMLFAGSETSAVTAAFTLYELAQNPQIQDRLRKEILETLDRNKGEATYEAITKMEYLDQVLKESMRLWPLLPFLDRVAGKPYQLPGTDVVIDKGTLIFIPLYSIQRDPQYFRDPNVFDPDRFSKENIGSIPELAYMPFGVGPRYCVGKRFGLLSVKNALVHLLRRNEVRLSSQTFKKPEWNTKAMTLDLKDGLTLTVRPL